MPSFSYLKGISWRDIPLKLFIVNVVITAIYTIGVLSALYASLLVPERSNTAVMSSGLINGVATMLLIIFIDPKISILADDVINQRGSYLSLKRASVMMMGSRLLGTFLAQLLFIPGAKYIAWFTQFM
ncbi:hypothetical protein LSPCS325_15680 [Lysinibacillus sp. CTST325]